MTENPETTPSEQTPEIPANWESLGLSQDALDLIAKAGFKQPSPVQAQAIRPAVAGKDILASAQTGTGKTAAFVLPMVEKFAGREGTFGLILAPTREIAQQIEETVEIFGASRGVRSIVLIGGINMKTDTVALNTYPHIIVATPGRLCDHLDRGNIWLDFIEVVVLDEADRMLDMGFTTQLNRIMEDVPQKRQTMLFSATITPTVDKLARKILNEPVQITIGKPMGAINTVEQRLLWVKDEWKNNELRKLLQKEKGSVMIFTRSKDGASRVFRNLQSAGFYDATYISSDRLQEHREQALATFKSGGFRILVATDVAARGIHVDQVALVINYDLPLEAENYVHRIGRTGRAGSTGRAITLVTQKDRRLLGDIERLLGHPVPADYAEGMEGAPASSAPSGDDAREERGGRGGRGGRGSRGGRDRERKPRTPSEDAPAAAEAAASADSDPDAPPVKRLQIKIPGRKAVEEASTAADSEPTGSPPSDDSLDADAEPKAEIQADAQAEEKPAAAPRTMRVTRPKPIASSDAGESREARESRHDARDTRDDDRDDEDEDRSSGRDDSDDSEEESSGKRSSKGGKKKDDRPRRRRGRGNAIDEWESTRAIFAGDARKKSIFPVDDGPYGATQAAFSYGKMGPVSEPISASHGRGSRDSFENEAAAESRPEAAAPRAARDDRGGDRDRGRKRRRKRRGGGRDRNSEGGEARGPVGAGSSESAPPQDPT